MVFDAEATQSAAGGDRQFCRLCSLFYTLCPSLSPLLSLLLCLLFQSSLYCRSPPTGSGQHLITARRYA